MITFNEHYSSNYKDRTWANVMLSDITIAFGVDYSTPGEVCTRNACNHYKRPLICLYISDEVTSDDMDRLIEMIKSRANMFDGLIINIAGNGIFTLNKYGKSQQDIDLFVFNILAHIKGSGIEIKEIRSGGQTGADESGLKAALKLDIPAVCLCPKGWKYRTTNENISNEELFKSRFL